MNQNNFVDSETCNLGMNQCNQYDFKNNCMNFCDNDLKQYKKIYLHPFVNDMTICLKIDDLENFLNQYHIPINWVNI